jgi:hypothetical protein
MSITVPIRSSSRRWLAAMRGSAMTHTGSNCLEIASKTSSGKNDPGWSRMATRGRLIATDRDSRTYLTRRTRPTPCLKPQDYSCRTLATVPRPSINRSVSAVVENTE